MDEKKSKLYPPIIVFPSEEAKDDYDKELEEKGWHTIETGPSINIEEVKRRRFDKEEDKNGKV